MDSTSGNRAAIGSFPPLYYLRQLPHCRLGVTARCEEPKLFGCNGNQGVMDAVDDMSGLPHFHANHIS